MLEDVNVQRTAILAAGVALAACSGARTTEAGSATGQTLDPRAAVAGAASAARVTPLTVRTVDGRSVAVPTSGRPTIVFAMAAWCMSCLQGAADLSRLYDDYESRGLQVVAIDIDPTEHPADLDRFRTLAGNPRYFWAMDEGQRATRTYSLRALDTTILVSGSGEVLFRSDSLPDPQTLRRAVQKALGL